MMETRKIRFEKVKPNFSLRTGFYTIGGNMLNLYLRNSGGVANDVRVDLETNIGSKKLFSPSIDNGQEICLIAFDLPEIKNSEGFVKVKVSCKDSYPITKNIKQNLRLIIKNLRKKREKLFSSMRLWKKLLKILQKIL